MFARFQAVAGILYLMVTGVLLFWLIDYYFDKIKLLEKELDESTETYETIFEMSGTATVIVNSDFQIELANHKFEKILGYSKSDVLHMMYWNDLVPESEIPRLDACKRRLKSGNLTIPRSFESKLITKDRNQLAVVVSVSQLERTGRFVISFLDLTPHKKAEELAKHQREQLMQADRMATLGILVSGMAHEINNPNNYILLNAKILTRTWDELEPILKHYYEMHGDFLLGGMPYSRAYTKLRQLITGVGDGAVRIHRIVQSLKDFSRKDPGHLGENVNLNTVIESSIVILNNLIQKTTNHFVVKLGKNLPDVVGNFQQLEQVVINLVTNACQALPDPDRTLRVMTRYDSPTQKVIVEISDEGIGIPAENFSHILDPFFTTKRDTGGTGLGLSICYNIVNEHGGELDIQSEAAQGTVVRVSLPIDRKIKESPDE
ncbi:PAS domain S-box protein [bacterium]|nr:PAS domain S-box protein [bacterium]